ncbi:GNAT family N-acetyltransferase [Ancylobacter mangrovi]|uniref:GNAT family N-acetyltransferase n=1 Tax=Ancylobacter mangrovi TaxID=2972472 RepID=UPI0021639107|nr:GNAT family N-acetyltransferase [Ancylobacter mangrovi]MCS0504561.1 GNAT family N-acetyltransferase [Ancylobacter mangrovi]
MPMPPDIRLATARPDDAEAILAVHRAAIRGTAADFYPPEIIEAWAPVPIRHAHVEALALRIENGIEEAVVARARGVGIVGFGSFVPDRRELRAVYVHPDYGRKGIGAAMLAALERRARRYGLRELVMDASLNAEAFYRSHGFVVERTGEHVLGGGLRMACIRMRKPLGGH